MQSIVRSQVFAAPVGRRTLVIQAAHKKGAGSTKNGRDSNAQRRGVKAYGGQPVRAGGIIVRQVGSTWNAGDNCGLGSDFTVYSTVDGIVVFDKGSYKPEVHVYPLDHPKAIAAVTATHTRKPADGKASRRDKRKAQFSTRKSQGTLAVAQVAVPTQP